MIARRVVRNDKDRTYKDYPCNRTTVRIASDRVTLTLVGGKFDGKTLALTPGSPDLLVTMERNGNRPGDTVEVYHEPNWYTERDNGRGVREVAV